MSARTTIRSRRREGAVMVLFALIVVGMFAVFALIVDLGFATLNQRRMQTAADASALEILRDRDHTQLNQTQSSNPYTRDRRRRQFNTTFADAPFVPEVGVEITPGSTRGPGGWIDVGPGSGPLRANAQVTGSGWSAPGLHVNYVYDDVAGIDDPLNRRHGDVVSGRWMGDGVGGLGGNPRWMETADYQRLDFEPADAADAPFGRSVLVRLRRTRTNFDAESLAFDAEPLVSSTGRTIPLLFGSGTTIRGSTQPTEEFSIRHSGISVRATAIADSTPAVRIGVAQPGGPNGWDIGLVPVAFFEGVLLSDNPLWWEFDADGNRYMDLTRDENDRYIFDESGEWLTGVLIADESVVLGGSVELAGSSTPGWADPSHWARGEGYAPIWGVYFSGGLRRLVIGFLRVRVEVATDAAGTPIVDPNTGEPLMRVTRLSNQTSPGMPWIAYRNASASFGGRRPDLPPVLWERVLDELNSLDGAIHAPSLAR